ncbi:transcriptional regulator, partial [Jeotgalibacillus aurantiacus]|uniref:transcriptional regulator n=1 Tax=Jeotgalibacillus aurantiacus TaxID=2763266 RepID=UPI001D0AF047
KLFKYRQQGHTVKMIYMDKTGLCSERRIKIRQLGENSFTAFCLKRGAVRTFQYDSILSVVLVIKREKAVI